MKLKRCTWWKPQKASVVGRLIMGNVVAPDLVASDSD